MHESLFAETDSHVRLLHQQHGDLMRSLRVFEEQQEGRWRAYTEADRLQQESFRETASRAQETVLQVQRFGDMLESARHDLNLLHEAVEALQADAAACEARLDECMQRTEAAGKPAR